MEALLWFIFTRKELWFCVLATVTLVTLLLLLVLWATPRLVTAANVPPVTAASSDNFWATLSAFVLRTMFMKEVFLLSNNTDRQAYAFRNPFIWRNRNPDEGGGGFIVGIIVAMTCYKNRRESESKFFQFEIFEDALKPGDKSIINLKHLLFFRTVLFTLID
jgi:hypothetical protein